jgi:hypothetical protein
MKSEREIALDAQEKFEFYLIGLVFTLLALSIQTSKFGQSSIGDLLELLGWIALLISGLAGLSRLEYIPEIREKYASHDEFKEELSKLQAQKAKGETTLFVVESQSQQPIGSLIENRLIAINTINKSIKALEAKNHTKYSVHKYAFVAGILLVATARAYIPATNLLCKLFHNVI